MSERMEWHDGRFLRIGDDEIARFTIFPSLPCEARIAVSAMKGARLNLRKRMDESNDELADRARREIVNLIRNGRGPLLSRAEEDVALARRIAAADLPEEDDSDRIVPCTHCGKPIPRSVISCPHCMRRDARGG